MERARLDELQRSLHRWRKGCRFVASSSNSLVDAANSSSTVLACSREHQSTQATNKSQKSRDEVSCNRRSKDHTTHGRRLELTHRAIVEKHGPSTFSSSKVHCWLCGRRGPVVCSRVRLPDFCGSHASVANQVAARTTLGS